MTTDTDTTTRSEPLADAERRASGTAATEVEKPGTMTAEAAEPARATRPTPSVTDALGTWAVLAGATALVNLVVHGIAVAAGASMTADTGFMTTSISVGAVIAATAIALLTATFGWALVAHRVPAFAHLWVPLGAGVGLLSLAGLIGVSDLGTGIALAVMHVLTTVVATVWIPKRLPR